MFDYPNQLGISRRLIASGQVCLNRNADSYFWASNNKGALSKNPALAQLVEHAPDKGEVDCSNQSGGTKQRKIGRVVKATAC